MEHRSHKHKTEGGKIIQTPPEHKTQHTVSTQYDTNSVSIPGTVVSGYCISHQVYELNDDRRKPPFSWLCTDIVFRPSHQRAKPLSQTVAQT